MDFKLQASRAWEAGHWARFTLQGFLSMNLANTCYIVLGAEGCTCRIMVNKATTISRATLFPTVGHPWAKQRYIASRMGDHFDMVVPKLQYEIADAVSTEKDVGYLSP